MVSWKCSCLILKPMNVTLSGKRDFADMFELRILSWEVILDYLGGALDVRVWREGDVTREAEMRWCALKMQGGATSQRSTVATRCWKRQGQGFSLGSLLKESALLTRCLVQWNCFQTSELQNCKRLNSRCFKAARCVVICLHYFPIAAIHIFKRKVALLKLR